MAMMAAAGVEDVEIEDTWDEPTSPEDSAANIALQLAVRVPGGIPEEQLQWLEVAIEQFVQRRVRGALLIGEEG